MKRLLLLFVVAILVLAGVLLYNIYNFKSRQLHPEPFDAAGIDEVRAVERLSKALTFKTISHQDPAEFKGAPFEALHGYLQKSYPKVHEILEREVISDYSLLYKWTGKQPEKPPVVLLAHTDVVPVEDPAAWAQPPFSGKVDGGHIWGRGAIDDKSSVMAILEAAETLAAGGFQPERTVYFAFGHDEEIGGMDGARVIANRLEERGVKAWFTLDEGSAIIDGIVPGLDAPLAVIAVGEKGYISLKLTAHAPGGHSSQPPEHTAIGVLAQGINRLEERQMPARLEGPLYDLFQYAGPEMQFPYRLVMANLWLFGPLLEWQLVQNPTTAAGLRTTTAVTIVDGGTKDNVLPAKAEAVVNFRILPGDTAEEVEAHAWEVLSGLNIDVSVLGRHEVTEPSPLGDVDSGSYRLLNKTSRQLYPGVPVAPGICPGGTDSKHYYGVAENTYRFQPLVFTRQDLERIHGANERISIKNYLKAIQFYIQLLRNSQ